MARILAPVLVCVLMCGAGLAYAAGEADPGIRIEEAAAPDSGTPGVKRVAPGGGDLEKIREERDRLRDELLLHSMQKSPAGAWAMSFFIGLAVPVLGSGQYYANSIATAIPTTVLGVASYGCMIWSLTVRHPSAALKTAGAVSAGVYGAAWLFDWIYAIVATKRYNNGLREKYFPPVGRVTPRFNYASRPCGDGGMADHSFAFGLAMRF